MIRTRMCCIVSFSFINIAVVNNCILNIEIMKVFVIAATKIQRVGLWERALGGGSYCVFWFFAGPGFIRFIRFPTSP